MHNPRSVLAVSFINSNHTQKNHVGIKALYMRIASTNAFHTFYFSEYRRKCDGCYFSFTPLGLVINLFLMLWRRIGRGWSCSCNSGRGHRSVDGAAVRRNSRASCACDGRCRQGRCPTAVRWPHPPESRRSVARPPRASHHARRRHYEPQ